MSLLDREKFPFPPPVEFAEQVSSTAAAIPSAAAFIREVKPWHHTFRQSMTRWVLVIAALGMGWYLMRLTAGLWTAVWAAVSNGFANPEEGVSKFFQFFDYNGLFQLGFLKYVILFTVEALVFNIVRHSYNVLLHENVKPTPKMLVDALVRSFRNKLHCYIHELIWSILASIIFGILGLKFLGYVAKFIIQGYFLGFSVIDTYYDSYKFELEDAERRTRKFAGISVTVGLLLMAILSVPLIGVFIAPIFGAIWVLLVMRHFDPDPVPMTKEEKKALKMEKKARKLREKAIKKGHLPPEEPQELSTPPVQEPLDLNTLKRTQPIASNLPLKNYRDEDLV